MTAASLILGHNGIWGDLVDISPAGVEHLSRLLAPYKAISRYAASASPVRTGGVGDMIETYEKIDPESGKGLVVIFANITMKGAWGKPLTMRQPLVAKLVTDSIPHKAVWHTRNATLRYDTPGHAILTATFDGSDAAIFYFGADTNA